MEVANVLASYNATKNYTRKKLYSIGTQGPFYKKAFQHLLDKLENHSSLFCPNIIYKDKKVLKQ